MSSTEYFRYPDGVRSGSTSPSDSRNRSFDSLMSSSGNSAERSASAWPMLLRAVCRTGLLARRRAGEEDQAELADPDLVPVLQQRVVDPVAVHVGAVEAADVVDPERASLPVELDVPSGDGDVVEEDVALRMPTGADRIGVEQVAA